MWEENTTLTLGHTIEGLRGHTLEGHRVEGLTLEGQTVEGLTPEGQTVEGLTLEGQTVEGYSEATEAGNFSVDWREDLDVALFQDYPEWMLLTAFSCCVAFLVCGLPGNVITILALARCKKVRNTTAIFIINLSVSDLLFGCFNLPLAASVFLTRRWVWGAMLCQLFPLLRYGLLGVSVFNILAITINRYVMIAHPNLYPRLYSPRWLPLHVAGTWLGAFSFLIPTTLELWGQFGLDPAIGSCTILQDTAHRSAKEFLFVFAFLAPCIAIIVCYARIFVIAHRSAQKSGAKKEEARDRARAGQGAGQPREKEGAAVLESGPEFSSSSLPSSSHFSSASVQSKDTVTTQVRICSNSLAPPSPRPRREEREQEQGGEGEGAVSRERRESCLSFSLRVPAPSHTRRGSITHCREACNLVRDLTRRKSLRPGRLAAKDRRLLKMIAVIFVSFLICYLPITVVKILDNPSLHALLIASKLLIYLTTCINPIIYVFMSSEYRQAYCSLLTCQPPGQYPKKSRRNVCV